MSPRAINEIVHGKRSITTNSDLRIAKYFGTSREFWLNLQTSYDLEEASKDGIGFVAKGDAGAELPASGQTTAKGAMVMIN